MEKYTKTLENQKFKWFITRNTGLNLLFVCLSKNMLFPRELFYTQLIIVNFFRKKWSLEFRITDSAFNIRLSTVNWCSSCISIRTALQFEGSTILRSIRAEFFLQFWGFEIDFLFLFEESCRNEQTISTFKI